MLFKHLSDVDCAILEEPFCIEENKEEIWLNASKEIPWPHGFNMVFFKICFNTLQEDLISFINGFYVSRKLPKSITSSFLTFIPKFENSKGK